MFALILWTIITGSATHGTINYEDCKSFDFKPKACWTSEKLKESGEALKKL